MANWRRSSFVAKSRRSFFDASSVRSCTAIVATSMRRSSFVAKLRRSSFDANSLRSSAVSAARSSRSSRRVTGRSRSGMSSEADAILPSSSAGAMPAQNRNESVEWSDSDRRFCCRVHETVRTTCRATGLDGRRSPHNISPRSRTLVRNGGRPFLVIFSKGRRWPTGLSASLQASYSRLRARRPRAESPEPQDVDRAALRANWQAQCSRYETYFIGE